MKIFVRGNTLVSVNAETHETISELKSRICKDEGFNSEICVLSYHGKPLLDEQTLAACDINSYSTIDLSVKLFGGKVHGSLARAGKVKGQTPKVEKQEKKKAKTGRAKRRMQYNRRFVNVVAGGRMKKRGPNSNST